MRTLVDMSPDEALLVQAFRLLPTEQQHKTLIDVVEAGQQPSVDFEESFALAADEIRLVLRLRAIKPELRQDAAHHMHSASYQVQPNGDKDPNEPEPDYKVAERWARFLIGFINLQGVLTDEQREDHDDALLHTLTDGLEAAARDYDANGYDSLQELCGYAEWGKLRQYRPGEGDRDYINID